MLKACHLTFSWSKNSCIVYRITPWHCFDKTVSMLLFTDLVTSVNKYISSPYFEMNKVQNKSNAVIVHKVKFERVSCSNLSNNVVIGLSGLQ